MVLSGSSLDCHAGIVPHLTEVDSTPYWPLLCF